MHSFGKLAFYNPAQKTCFPLYIIMKKHTILILLFLCIFVLRISAQVTFVVQSLPSYTPLTDSLYIAGNFTGWDPGSLQYMLHKNGEGKWSITLAAQASGTSIQFKFTRGSFAKVEKDAGGNEMANRTYTFNSSSSIVNVTIANWADAGGGSNSTAAANVKIMSTDFFIPQLNRYRRIWIYYPLDYETSGKSYPVLYMHDGQNLFDAKTSFSGEWEVDETLNKLALLGKQVPIVVGIDNGGADRIGEYTPWPNAQYGGGDGDKYMRFIVETLKPYIDQHYRTLPDRENTGIMGSSLGGLISQYGSVKFQETFSKAGIFSPSYWFSDNVWSFTHNTGKQHDMRFYQLCGTNEGSSSVVSNMKRMNDSLVSIGFGKDKIFNKIVEGGQHNEKLWREAFGEAYLWLFDTSTSSIGEPAERKEIGCFPNPVSDFLTLHSDIKVVFDTIQIFDINGRPVKTFMHHPGNIIDVHELLPGIYLLRCASVEDIFVGKFIKK
jgi:predicted alpha/beta superfamily hydrolase